MAEPKLVSTIKNRRLQHRFAIPPDSAAMLQFRYPAQHGTPLRTRLRDISLSGISMTLPAELYGVQAGDIVKGIEARVEAKTFRGDLLVMHVGPSSESGAICGGLFYPESDEDLITIRLVVRALEAQFKSIS